MAIIYNKQCSSKLNVILTEKCRSNTINIVKFELKKVMIDNDIEITDL